MAKFEDQEVQVQQQAVEVIDAEPKRKWQSYIWDSLGKSPEERHFLFKLDLAVLTFASLGEIGEEACLGWQRNTDHAHTGYFIKYLDQNNINNAFVSGM